ncbi:hypothetical protein [Agriterribacter sp.]|uniref:hypothetical protein n=1 Tax=Agriterribacter sp. TaxID=2821509 RepID=UPI002C0997AE|nr:hypothetical protein [Agriterribacter sp.]HTN09283.1 hypothetical protein [Agriterribacter sp.]
MIEVFKTNVYNRHDAGILIERIQQSFLHYQANFDLQDGDCILRVKCTSDLIQPALIIALLKDYGFDAEVLPDEVPFTARRNAAANANIRSL